MTTIQQTKKQSDLEKRLQLLRHQVYGKSMQSDTPIYQYTDITYLYQDLTKIGILASLAIAVQLILFVLKFF